MIYLLGLVVATVSLVAAALHLHQEAAHFWDFVAFICVLGGTFSFGMMIFPWQYRRLILKSMMRMFAGQKNSDGKVVLTAIEFVKSMQAGARAYKGENNTLAGEVLRDGAELLSLGFSREKVQEILDDRIHQSYERAQKVASAVRSLAKYPPAFGLAGTVLGLVTLMRRVSDGADAKETGLTMAIALMATFYGLLTANLLVNPAGENMAKMALADKKQAEIALHAIILFANGASLLEAQEVLNSYVVHEERVNILGSFSEAA